MSQYVNYGTGSHEQTFMIRPSGGNTPGPILPSQRALGADRLDQSARAGEQGDQASLPGHRHLPQRRGDQAPGRSAARRADRRLEGQPRPAVRRPAMTPEARARARGGSRRRPKPSCAREGSSYRDDGRRARFLTDQRARHARDGGEPDRLDQNETPWPADCHPIWSPMRLLRERSAVTGTRATQLEHDHDDEMQLGSRGTGGNAVGRRGRGLRKGASGRRRPPTADSGLVRRDMPRSLRPRHVGGRHRSGRQPLCGGIRWADARSFRTTRGRARDPETARVRLKDATARTGLRCQA